MWSWIKENDERINRKWMWLINKKKYSINILLLTSRAHKSAKTNGERTFC